MQPDAPAPVEVSTDQRAPDWILAYAADVRDLLGLGEWDITVQMVDDIDGDPSIGGRCSFQEPYRIARVYLARGFTKQQYREFLMHELLHAALAPMDYAAITAVKLVPKPQRKVAEALIRDGCERAVVALSKALVRGIRPPQPESSKDDEDTNAAPEPAPAADR